MSAADDLYVETESERIQRWRAKELKRGRYDHDEAAELASRSYVDLHLARLHRERLSSGDGSSHFPLSSAAVARAPDRGRVASLNGKLRAKPAAFQRGGP